MRTKILALLVMLCICAGTLFSQVPEDWYQNKPIRSITFEGLRNVTRTEIEGMFNSYIGKNFTDDLYWEILQRIYAVEYFDEVTPVALPGDSERKTVQLNFIVKEKPVIKKILFSGNRRLSRSSIMERITLKESDIFNELKYRIDERAVRDLYLEKGYASVRVTSELITNDDGSINIQFLINEGKQTVISDIEFEGNRVFNAKTLKKEMKLKESRVLFSSGTFTEALLETDKSALKSFYNEKGYIDAVVEMVLRETDTESSPDRNLLKLTFVIREGEQYTYGGTEITGNTIFSTEELLSKIRLKPGDILNLNRLTEGFQAISEIYFENGYTSNYVNIQDRRDVDRRTVSYVITIIEQDRSHIENIIIRGNTKTKDKVITRELMFEPGDIFSRSKLLDSIRNLYNLRFFSMVIPDFVPGSEENLIDVVINVEEQSAASIQFGVTFSGANDSDSFPLSLFVQWEDKNFLGNGNAFGASLTVSPDTQSLTLSFSENWFLGTPLSVGFNLTAYHKELYTYRDDLFPIFDDAYYDEYGSVPDPYNSRGEYEDSASLDDAYRMQYEQWLFSAGVSTGYRWLPRFATVTLRGGLNFGLVQNFYDEMVYRPADKNIRDRHGKWVWTNYVWTSVALDRRDLNYDSSKGFFLSERLTYYGIIPSLETEYYFRSDTKGELYITLLDLPVAESWSLKFVLAGFTTFSFLVPISDSQISDSSKLYIDGMFHGRGWTNLYSKSSNYGNLMLSHSLELRMPLFPGVIALDFFMDAVAIKPTLQDMGKLKIDDYYFSFGPGIRFSIPQFPLRLLFANTFRIQDGKFEWRNGKGADWTFVLSFSLVNY
ncbi:outer membrane protein assembly factor BamA [Brucepastera parasyntrophica]|uniref:outer membrane protein assembly factor BamA n=1 Tax=Brucepastera parasyntrophica TaxID=2880008 RepID=UPI00210AC6CD|nr:outer membrane protein assembly factor BamA [Brucepastera parasyntrophica]ULQ59845.1 outer membrane protein assembly factor BamA [Brucepastera parasyntrophica]